MNSVFDQHQLDAMINDPRNYKWGLFYFNKNDSRIIVPKRLKFMGWTMNFAKPAVYFVIFVIVAVTILVANMDKILN